MKPLFLYLHGFASSPDSSKAQAFARGFAEAGIRLEIPDLAEGDFGRMTITSQLRVVERVAGGRPVSLIGSSLGGYLAALYAARHPETSRCVLMAPAFAFPTRWAARLGEAALEDWRRTGRMAVFHYGSGREEMLGTGFLEDATQYEDFPAAGQPMLIFHGNRDEVVPAELSEEFTRRQPRAVLRMLDSDHGLLDALELIWREARAFLLG